MANADSAASHLLVSGAAETLEANLPTTDETFSLAIPADNQRP
tara:strand:- start:481 stop:609 length:129 start_codon:yes stop_codon:yes gene_type:complete